MSASVGEPDPVGVTSTAEDLRQAAMRIVLRDGLDPSQLRPLFDQLQDAIERGEPLRCLIVGEPIGANACLALAESLRCTFYTSLTRICMWRAAISDSGFIAFCGALPNLHRLRVLDLIDCDLIEASACCAALSTALMTRNAPPLTQLALNYNRIGDEGLQILHRSLRWVLARGLTTLSMSFCELGSASGAILSSLLCGTRSSIRRLNLEGNHLGDAGLDQLSAGLECSTTVTGLILSANRIAAPFHGLRRFCDAVRGCGSLRLIDLDGNPLDDDAVQSVLNMIRTSAHLHDVRLWPGTTPALYQSVQTALLKNREIGAPAAASVRSRLVIGIVVLGVTAPVCVCVCRVDRSGRSRRRPSRIGVSV